MHAHRAAATARAAAHALGAAAAAPAAAAACAREQRRGREFHDPCARVDHDVVGERVARCCAGRVPWARGDVRTFFLFNERDKRVHGGRLVRFGVACFGCPHTRWPGQAGLSVPRAKLLVKPGSWCGWDWYWRERQEADLPDLIGSAIPSLAVPPSSPRLASSPFLQFGPAPPARLPSPPIPRASLPSLCTSSRARLHRSPRRLDYRSFCCSGRFFGRSAGQVRRTEASAAAGVSTCRAVEEKRAAEVVVVRSEL